MSGQLAALWPPLLARTPTSARATGTLSALATSNGEQVNCNGHVLYTFVEDSPGQVTGQGVQNFFVATADLAPAGSTASTAPPAAATGSGSGRGSGYGY